MVARAQPDLLRLALLLLLSAGVAEAGEKRWYEIRIEGQLAGYTVYEKTRPDPQRRGAFTIEGHTRLSFHTAEGQGLLRLAERTRYLGDRPVEHELQRVRDETTEKVVIRFAGGTAEVEITGKGSKVRLSVRLPDEAGRACGLFGAYRRLAAVQGKTTLRLFDPRTNRVETVRVERLRDQVRTVNGVARRAGLFALAWGERREQVALDTESGWPISVERTAPVRTTFRETDAGVAERVKGLVLRATPLFRRALPDAAAAYRVFHKRVLVAEGRFELRAAPSPAAYRLVDKVSWGRVPGALQIRLSGTLRSDLRPLEMRKSRTGGNRRALAITCSFLAGRVEQVSSGEHAALSGVTPLRGPVYPLDLECPGLFALFASQLPHEAGAVAYYPIYDWKRLRRYFVRARRLPARAGDAGLLLRFVLSTPDGEIELATDARGRFEWLSRGDLLVQRVR